MKVTLQDTHEFPIIRATGLLSPEELERRLQETEVPENVIVDVEIRETYWPPCFLAFIKQHQLKTESK